MLGLVYLSLAIVFGITFVALTVDTKRIYASAGGRYASHRVLKSLFIIPAGSIFGMMAITFTNYYLIYMLSALRANQNYNYPIGIFLTTVIFAILCIFQIKKLKSKNIEKTKLKKRSIVFYACVCAFLILVPTFLMFYSYYLNRDGILKVGVSVFSDLSPHTAMTSSFGVGANVPTEYMHFPNDRD